MEVTEYLSISTNLSYEKGERRRSFTYLIRKDLNNEWEEGRKEEERSSISKTHTHM